MTDSQIRVSFLYSIASALLYCGGNRIDQEEISPGIAFDRGWAWMGDAKWFYTGVELCIIILIQSNIVYYPIP